MSLALAVRSARALKQLTARPTRGQEAGSHSARCQSCFSPMTMGKRGNEKKAQWTLPAVICPEEAPRAPKYTAGHLPQPPSRWPLKVKTVSTDAHAAPLLHCSWVRTLDVSGLTSVHPSRAQEAGWVTSGGRGPAQHDPRGRLEAAPQGFSAAGQQLRPGRWFTAKNCMPTNNPYSASQ